MKKVCSIRTSWLGSVWHCTFWSILPLFVDHFDPGGFDHLWDHEVTQKDAVFPPFSVRQCPKMGSIPSWIIWAIRSMCSDTCMYTLYMSLYVYTYVYIYICDIYIWDIQYVYMIYTYIYIWYIYHLNIYISYHLYIYIYHIYDIYTHIYIHIYIYIYIIVCL